MSWFPIEGPPLNSILDSTARINIWGGPVRSGKTVHSLIRWLEFVLTAPKGDLWMLGRTAGSLERNILAPLRDFTGGKFSYSFSQGKAWFGGREIYIIGASNKDAEGRIRGSTAAGAYGDEVTLWPAEVFRQLGLRMSVKGAKAFYTTNPDGPYHWLKTEYIDKRRSSSNPDGLNLAYFEWPISANATLDPDYIAALEKEYTGLWYKRFIQGLWVAADGAIYDFWDETLYTITECPPADEYWLCFDYGTSNATAGGLFGKRAAAPGHLRAWLEREYYYSGRETGKQKTDAQYVDDIIQWLVTDRAKVRGVILDPSAASFKAELRGRGFTVKDANNDVLNGIRRQAAMLTSGEYRVHASCAHTIQDYGAYLWDSKASNRGEDKPLKQNDHCFVAGTPVHTRRGIVPIEQVKVGDEVLTRIGYRPVLKSGLTLENADVYEFECSNGAKLTATATHPVFVQGKGFTHVDTLRYGDIVIAVWDELEPLSIRELNSADTLMPKARQTNGIFALTQDTSVMACKPFTAKSGVTITAKSQRTLKFTIRMAIQEITTSLILNVYLALNISPHILGNPSVSVSGSTCNVCKKRRGSGTAHQRAESGIHALQRLLSQLVNQSEKPVGSAVKSTKPFQEGAQTSSVLTLASLPPDVRQEWMRLLETASSVDVTSPPISTVRLAHAHISAEPRYAGKANVYDITVQDLPEFFAGGILVHNTKDAERYFLLTEFPVEGEQYGAASLSAW